MTKYYFIYILTNQYNKVLYIGVTNNLVRRIWEHKNKINNSSSFTKKYNINKLVYYENCESITDAITREKQLKGGPRKQKVDLINRLNPEWKDLYIEITE